MQGRISSFGLWFVLLFFLNMLDILTTVPAYEANPVTLYIWEQIGYLSAAWLKGGLVLLFGLLFTVAQKVVNPEEWSFAKRVFVGILKVLVAFYLLVVVINLLAYTV
ncbi:hypothetical protein GWN63_03455 [Candidatus Bathyarchaeota archaeon]|nr:hypothetical protein [Candidatus Bathyarchaeota archaeon]NIU81286.1 hypothetical protein [Candidatus Bathyarchaeota archaeon]NIV67921.1 hypothetical protein [Candidatus Bathyarchaeota archaeon]NIW16362.1 hypothetical protein [Candidatus Bathyarchaeota archaeon]